MADDHPLVVSAQRLYPAQGDRVQWARAAALEAEGRLTAARQLGPESTDIEYADAVRAAARSVHLAHQEYSAIESLRWKETSIRELEAIAVTRFGAKQVIVSLGYEPGLR